MHKELSLALLYFSKQAFYESSEFNSGSKPHVQQTMNSFTSK